MIIKFNKKHITELFAMVIGYPLMMGSIFIGNRFMTEVIPPHTMGMLGLAQTAGIIAGIWPSGLAYTLGRYFILFKSRNKLGEFVAYINRCLMKWSVAIVAIAIVACLFDLFGITHHWGLLIALGLLSSIPGATYSLLSTCHNTERRRFLVSIHMFLFSGLRPFVAGLMGLVLLRTETILIGYFVWSFLVTYSLWYFFNKKHNHELKASELLHIDEKSELNKYTRSMYSFQVVNNLQPFLERWVLGIFSPVYVGLYMMVYGLSSLATQIVSSTINMFLYPILFPKADKINSKDDFYSLLKLYILNIFLLIVLFALMLLFCMYFKDFLINCLFSSKYQEVKDYFMIILLSQILLQISIVGFSSIGQALKNMKVFVVIRFLSIVIYIPLGFLLTKTNGLLGFSWSILVGQLLLFVFSLFAVIAICIKHSKRNYNQHEMIADAVV